MELKRFDSKEFGEINERATGELDVEKRAADYRLLQDLMEQSGSYIFLTHGANGVLCKDRVVAALRPDGRPLLTRFRGD